MAAAAPRRSRPLGLRLDGGGASIRHAASFLKVQAHALAVGLWRPSLNARHRPSPRCSDKADVNWLLPLPQNASVTSDSLGTAPV
jgi:hypothetical protein